MEVTQLADVPGRFASQWHSRGWGDLCALHGVEHQMSLPLHVGHKHLERAYSKLGVSDRVSAVRRATQLGLLAGRELSRPGQVVIETD